MACCGKFEPIVRKVKELQKRIVRPSKKCVLCGKTFWPPPGHEEKQFCSVNCATKHKNLRS